MHWRWLRAAVYLLMVLTGLGALVQGQPANNTSQPPVYSVQINGVINPGSAGLLQHAVQTAEHSGASALVVKINTPGGLLSSTRDMVTTISEAQVPVVGYVGPAGASATSAGAFILLSTHLAIMNSGTNVGASSPVAGDGGDIQGTLGKKAMSDSRAFMRSIANNRGRNADIAERFVSEAESLTAKEALDAEVINLVIDDESQLLQAMHNQQVQLHGDTVTLAVGNSEIREVKPRLLDRLLSLIAHPQIAHMLISLGMLAIYIEILSPGVAFPGVFGTIAVILGLVGLHSLPVQTGFLILLFLGLGLMVAEYFVAGFGILGIGGAVAFILGSLNLFDAPTTEESRSTILSVSIAVSGAMLVTTFLITRSLLSRSKRHKSMEGKIGEAMVAFNKTGYVLIEDERWAAETDEPLQHGDRVKVISHRGGQLRVRKIDADNKTAKADNE